MLHFLHILQCLFKSLVVCITVCPLCHCVVRSVVVPGIIAAPWLPRPIHCYSHKGLHCHAVDLCYLPKQCPYVAVDAQPLQYHCSAAIVTPYPPFKTMSLGQVPCLGFIAGVVPSLSSFCATDSICTCTSLFPLHAHYDFEPPAYTIWSCS